MPEPFVKILLVEDDEDDVVLVREMLREAKSTRYQIDWEPRFARGLERLATGGYDACLVDFRLGERDGVEFVREAVRRDTNVPLILLTGQGDYETDIAAMRAGAFDYLTKMDLNAALLDRSIRYAIRQSRAEAERIKLVSERRQAEAVARAAREHAQRLEEEIGVREKVEAALRESEARFRALSDASPQLVWTMDADATSQWVNRRWVEYFGSAPDAMGNSWWSKLTHPDDADGVVAAWARSVESGEPFEVECRLLRRDGQYRWHLGRALPVRDTSGTVLRWCGTCTDIHDLKLAEAELARHRERLEDLVRERTAELERSHQRLRLSERMASLGTFSAGLGHDMGNLLLPIRARLDVLRNRSLPADVREDLEAISSCASYLQALARGLRLFALDPEDQGASAGATELGAWSREAMPFFRTAVGKRIELVGQIPAGLPPLGVAPHRLTQAVLNLVNNARDAIGPERTDGRVTIRAEMARNGMVRVAVIDNGPGMTPEVRQRATEPFFTTKTRGISTGLGLALVHGIAEAAGGEVEIVSASGEGTSVAMVLPVARPAAPERQEPVGTAALSVEDLRIRSLLSAVLGMMGFEVEPTPPCEPRKADLWVTEEEPRALDVAAAFVREDPARRVIVLSEEPALAAAWEQAGATVLARSSGPGAIRAAVLNVLGNGRAPAVGQAARAGR